MVAYAQVFGHLVIYDILQYRKRDDAPVLALPQSMGANQANVLLSYT